jgi:hypothetical protein
MNPTPDPAKSSGSGSKTLLTSDVVLRNALQLASMVPAFFFISSKKRMAAFSSSSA